MITYLKGNLLDSDCTYICHQVNCKGVMNGGIAKQIRKKWPSVYEVFMEEYENRERICLSVDDIFGDATLIWVEERKGFVFNMYSQISYGSDGRRYTSYDAFAYCLEMIAAKVPEGSSIGFPKGIGCGLGGGNWKVIYALIEEILGDDYDVRIYELEDT